VTVSGIAAVSVIAGQEQAERQDTHSSKSAPSAQTQPLADHGPAEVSQDTVTLSDGGVADVGLYGRYLDSNRAAIAAYQAFQLTDGEVSITA
jgi:hypothetical protein